jgi:hypothetical protein
MKICAVAGLTVSLDIQIFVNAARLRIGRVISTSGLILVVLYRFNHDDNALRKGWHVPLKTAELVDRNSFLQLVGRHNTRLLNSLFFHINVVH